MKPQYAPQTTSAKLGYLVEECGEVLAAVGKSQRWGLDSFNPEIPFKDRETNREWVLRELCDLENAIALVRETLSTNEGQTLSANDGQTLSNNETSQDPIKLEVGATAEPNTCGSCKFFERVKDHGHCNIRIPPWVAYKPYNTNSLPPNFVYDADGCDLYRHSGETYIVSKVVQP